MRQSPVVLLSVTNINSGAKNVHEEAGDADLPLIKSIHIVEKASSIRFMSSL